MTRILESLDEFRGELAQLDELLAEPIIRMMMASDGVRPETVRRLMDAARERALPQALVPPAHVIEACMARRLCA